MKFDLNQSIEILERTPTLLEVYLTDLSEPWLKNNEGKDTWSPFDILGHLIEGEKTDWMIRTNLILSDLKDKTFVPFDRFAQMETSPPISLKELLIEFRFLREANIIELKALGIQTKDLVKTGTHPDLGIVTLEELLSTWVTHDLGHIGQISRVMAKQYKENVGPWKAYLGVLK